MKQSFFVGEIIRFKNKTYLDDIGISAVYVGALGIITEVIYIDKRHPKTYKDGYEYRIRTYICANSEKVPTKEEFHGKTLGFWVGSQGIERVNDVQLEIF